MKNEYYDIACGDLEYLHFGLASHNYNRISVDAQQVAEKMLKSVLELACPMDENVHKLINGHNLRAIYDRIVKDQKDFVLDRDALSTLKDYYYDARYPGDNFVEVSRDECGRNLGIMCDVVEAVNNFRRVNKMECKHFDRNLFGVFTEDDRENSLCCNPIV